MSALSAQKSHPLTILLKEIMSEATKRELTKASYMWIVAQSVVGDRNDASHRVSEEFPVGMLGGLEFYLCMLTWP